MAQFILNPGRNSPTTSDIFIAQPDSYKEKLAGKLFIIVEIKGKKIEALKVINFLIDNIAHNFYQNEKIALRERISTLKVEHIFEIALTRTNRHLSEFLENEKLKTQLSDINITVGVLHDNLLHFANRGTNKLFLVYKSKSGERKTGDDQNERKYKAIDITQNAENGQATERDNNKLFSNVMSGEIPPKGHFFVSNEALPEYISNNQIIDIITALPPNSAVEQIKNTVTRINSYVPFMGIIIKSSTVQPEVSGARAETVANGYDSVSHLNRTEENTESLLTPSGLINPKKWLNLPFYKKNSQKQDPKKSGFSVKEKIFMKRKKSRILGLFGRIANLSLRILGLAFLLIAKLPRKLRFYFNRIPNLRSDSGKLFAKMYAYLSGMKKRSKIALLLSAVFLGLFFFNLSVIKVKNEEAKEIQEYKKLTEKIEKKQNNVEANLLYNNEEAAKQLFEEIETLINELPKETQKQLEQYENFKNKFEAQLSEIRRIKKPEDANVVADLKNANGQASPGNLILLQSENSIYSSDSNEKSIYILDLENKKVTTVTNLEESIASLKFPAANDEGLIYYLDNNRLLAFDSSEQQLNPLEAPTENDFSGYAASDTFGNRFYLLNSQTNQIYRYSPTQVGLGSPQPWLQSTDIDLKGAVDISIDGHIYVLKDDGEVLKLLRGQPIEFSLNDIDPVIEDPTRLYVSLNGQHIYILEPKNQRLVVFNKAGEFIIQYKFDQYQDLVDFAVNEREGSIYILADNKIIQTKAEHLDTE